MKNEIRLRDWFFIIFLFGCIFTAGTALAQNERIFILHSYHQEYPWTNNENEGFTQTVTNKLPAGNINFSTEYLDTKRVKFNEEYQEFFFHYLKQKYGLYSPDVIFCSDDNALTFLLRFKERLFGDVPVVFCGVNNLDVEKNLNRQQYTGVFEKKEIVQNLALLKKINPQPGNILILGDDSSTHQAIEQKIRADIASQFPKQKYTVLANNNLSYLIKQLKLHKEGVIFLTTIGGIKNEQDVVVPLQKTIASIVHAGNFTIISMEDVYLEEGVLGGYVTNGFSQGKEAANLTIQILHGNPPSSIPLIKESPNEFMFNYPQLKRFGLSISQLPEKSIILNRPQSFYDHYKYRIWSVVLFLIFQTFVIFILIQNIHKRKKAEMSLQKARDELERRVTERTSELAETNANLNKEIIERKHAEESIKKAALEWSTAMDASEDAIYLLDPNRHILQANKVFYLMTGCTPQAAIGQHIESIVHPEGEEVPCPVCLAQEEKRDAGIIMEPDHPDNPTGRPIEITVQVVTNDQEQPVSIFMRLHDLTGQRKIEDDLRQSKEEWENTFNAMSDIVTLQDTDYRIVKVNQAACTTLDLCCDNIIGKHCYELFHGSNEPCPECPLLVTQETFEPYTKEMIHEKLGKTFLVSAAPVLDDQGNLIHIVHVAKDITEKKKIEERLFLNEKLETIAGLAAGVAHEINTPLSAILQSQQMIEMRLDPDKPRNQERAAECGVDLTKVAAYFKNNELDFFIKGMRDSAITAGNIIKNLLEFSRPHKGEIRNANLPMLLDASLELARADYDLKKKYDIINVEIIKEYDSDLTEVPCVAMEIEQVLLNLIKNAVHAMADNDTENPCITVRTVRTEKMARIEVEDNGPGIDEETQLHIFDPFFTTKEVGQGTGLGLSVSHAMIVDKLKGNIWVESEPGKGAKFIVELPLGQEV